MYGMAKAFGYRLRICSRCHRYRLLPRPAETTVPSEEPEPKRRHVSRVAGTCPECGKADFRRSRRRWWERLILRGPMVRCRACRTRFPMPQAEEESPD
jgi:hypothetical protein